jgi:N-acetyl-anhydromuramyl-L-alanine amidase AmpD
MARRSRQPHHDKAAAVAGIVSVRSRIVWCALVAAMTGVGGILWLLQSSSTSPRLDGLALPPLVAAAGPSTIEAVYKTRQPIPNQRWQAIVIHHSGSLFATPASLEARAKASNLQGLGYHFVVGNGSGMDEGEIHVGYRWLDQLPGAHVAGNNGDWYNKSAIGICVVGDGRRRPFGPEQVRRVVQLVASLAERLNIPQDRIYLHSQLAATDDPGALFPEAAFREQLAGIGRRP